MNTNSNSYTIIYAAVLVIIVAFLLSFVSSTLKETQNANVELDTKKQILRSVNLSQETNEATAEVYNECVKDMLLAADGTLAPYDGKFNTLYDSEAKAGKHHVFVVNADGATKYVFPLSGNGLWGAIWGFISVNDDKNTVYGVDFSHASETAGLGAEITADAFKSQFAGKQAYEDGKAALKVVKNGNAKGNSEVDGISGGTLTSNGVSDMLVKCLGYYETFLRATPASAVVADTTAASVADTAAINIETKE